MFFIFEESRHAQMDGIFPIFVACWRLGIMTRYEIATIGMKKADIKNQCLDAADDKSSSPQCGVGGVRNCETCVVRGVGEF
jgi:hypothetical protein